MRVARVRWVRAAGLAAIVAVGGCGSSPSATPADPGAGPIITAGPTSTIGPASTTRPISPPTSTTAPSRGSAPPAAANTTSTIVPVEAAERPAPVGASGAPETSASTPSRVVIPTIGVDSSLESLGLAEDGRIAAPIDYGTAGWYVDGPSPGERGPAIIAGHVDSKRGPAVFWRLRELAPGDMVEVFRADGTSVRFRVIGSQQYLKDFFPVNGVYGPTSGAALRLVTCGGDFDRSTGHYRSNTVVFAVLA